MTWIRTHNGDYIYIGGWIKVSERLPPSGIDVLVCTHSKNGTQNIDKGYCIVNEIDPDDTRWVHRGTAEVTHWMPLPEFPEV